MLISDMIGRISQMRAIRSTLAGVSSLPAPEQIGALFSNKIGQVEPSRLSIKITLDRAYKKRGVGSISLDSDTINELCEKMSPLHEYMDKTSQTYAESDSETRFGMRRRIRRFAALHHLPIESAARIVEHPPRASGGNVRSVISAILSLLLSIIPSIFFAAPPVVSFLLFPILFESISRALYKVRRDLLPPEHFPCLEDAPKNIRAPLTVICATLAEHRGAARALGELCLSSGDKTADFALFLDLPDAKIAECDNDREMIADAVSVIGDISKECGRELLLIIRRREYDPRGGYIGRSENRDPAIDLTRLILGRRSACTLVAGTYDTLRTVETVLIVGPSCRFPDRFLKRLSALIYHPDNESFGGFFIGTDKGLPNGSSQFFSKLDICVEEPGFVFCPEALGLVIPPEPTVNDPMARKRLRIGYIGQIKLKGEANILPSDFFASLKKSAHEHIAAMESAITVGRSSLRRICSTARACIKDTIYPCMFFLIGFCALLSAEGKDTAAAASICTASLYFILPIAHSIVRAAVKREWGGILRSVATEFFLLSSLPLCTYLTVLGAFGVRISTKDTAKYASLGEILSVLCAYLLFLIAPHSTITLTIGVTWLLVLPTVMLMSAKCNTANIPKL